MTTAHQSNDGADGSSSESARRSDGTELSVDAIFAALKHPHRRYVLYYLSDRQEGAGVEELAEQIAEWEAESADRADRADRATDPERVVVTLHHTHLPKLDALGLVDHDPGADHVARCEETAGIDPYLAFAADYELVPN